MNIFDSFKDKKVIFICGLHRSGTSILHEVLKKHDAISGFENTGVPEDEGQHLQSIFSPAKDYGGAGRFGFFEEAKLTENSPLVNEKYQNKLMAEWANYWDLSKTLLIEKSPPNLIRTRFLQAMFPSTLFITVIRHPIAVAYATQQYKSSLFKHTKFSNYNLVDHWVQSYERFWQDKPHLKNHFVIAYEELSSYPEACFNAISDFLGVNIPYEDEIKNKNFKYFKKWEAGLNPLKLVLKKSIIRDFEKRVNFFGYSLKELESYSSYYYLNK